MGVHCALLADRTLGLKTVNWSSTTLNCGFGRRLAVISPAFASSTCRRPARRVGLFVSNRSRTFSHVQGSCAQLRKHKAKTINSRPLARFLLIGCSVYGAKWLRMPDSGPRLGAATANGNNTYSVIERTGLAADQEQNERRQLRAGGARQASLQSCAVSGTGASSAKIWPQTLQCGENKKEQAT